MTAYTQIASNRTKSVLFVGFGTALLLGVGWLLSEGLGKSWILPAAALFSIVQGFVSWFASDKVALASSGAQPLSEQEFPQVHRLMENLAITAGLPKPRLFIIEDSALNAFATGRDAKHAAIAVTRGLITKLEKSELEGVLAHELAHIGNEDIRLMSIVTVMAGALALASDWLMHSMWFGGRDDREEGGNPLLGVIALAAAILAPIAASLIQLAISRKREFLADATGVLITRYPEGLIGALKKISGDHEPLEAANKATAHMFFRNPLRGDGISKLFATHPPIAERVKALEAMQ